MRISLQLPLKSHLGQNLLLFKKEVESRSNGDIKVEIYDSAQLYKDKEVPAAVGSGSIESGVASLTRYVGDIPAVDLFYQPFLLNTDQKVRRSDRNSKHVIVRRRECFKCSHIWHTIQYPEMIVPDIKAKYTFIVQKKHYVKYNLQYL